MRLNLACADFSFPLLEHDRALQLIANLGCTGVDIGLFQQRSHFQHRDYLEDVERGARMLCDRVRGHGLEFADIFLQSGTNLEDLAENHPDCRQRQRSREVFLRTVELACACRAKHLTSLPGICWTDESADDSLRRAADELAWREEQARLAGIVYAIEPHLWSVVSTPQAALRLLELAPRLTLTLDLAHFVCQGMNGECMASLIAHTSHVHARAACPGRLQASLAENAVNFPAMLCDLRQLEYSGWIAIEYVRMAGVAEIAEVDNLSETILLRDHLKLVATTL